MGLELQFSISTILPFFLFFLFMLLNIIWRSKAKYSKSKLPPGPRKLPLIGNMHNLGGALPHQSLARLANQYGPLMHLQLGEHSCILVSSPEMAKEVMNTHDTIFATRPHVLSAEVITYGTKGIAFAPYGTHWRQMRKICTVELLTAKRVMSFRSIREQEVSNLIKDISLSEGRPINLSDELSSLAYGLTSRIAFGGKSKHQEAYIELMKDVLEAFSGFSVADLYPSVGILRVLTGIRTKFEGLHHEVDKILENIVNDHRDKSLDKKEADQEEGEDLVDILLSLQKHGELQLPLSDTVVKATILDIYTAGSDTVSTTVEWAMSEMVKNPRVMEKAQTEVRRLFDAKGYVDEASIHELKYLRSVIKETLRLHPPLPLLLPRECRENCEINGYEIPAKSRVIVNAWAIGRDPNYWIEPEKFYPERFIDSSIDYNGAEFQFIPFGAGRRMCPGLTFGTVNVEFILATLLFHFDWRTPEGNKPEELDMTESLGISVRRKYDLQLIPTTYRSAISFSHEA